MRDAIPGYYRDTKSKNLVPKCLWDQLSVEEIPIINEPSKEIIVKKQNFFKKRKRDNSPQPMKAIDEDLLNDPMIADVLDSKCKNKNYELMIYQFMLMNNDIVHKRDQLQKLIMNLNANQIQVIIIYN